MYNLRHQRQRRKDVTRFFWCSILRAKEEGSLQKDGALAQAYG